MYKALELLKKAKDNHFAIGAFNVCNIETLKAIAQAAEKLQAPVILEASDGEVNYFGIKELTAVVKILRNDLNIPLILNLDHGKDFETCKRAIEAGFDYIHFDGSALPLEDNIKITQEVVKIAHKYNLPVEGEMDRIQGSSEDHTKENPAKYQMEGKYTDSEAAYGFVKKTGIDVFAAFIGNLHGTFATSEKLNFDILKKLTAILPNTYFSLHGGSGISADQIKKAVEMGIVKVNVNTDMRIVFKKVLQKTLNESDEIAFYKLAQPAISAVQEVVEEKIKLFKLASLSD